MIQVTRLDGREFYINPHQIEYIELNPDNCECDGQVQISALNYWLILHFG